MFPTLFFGYAHGSLNLPQNLISSSLYQDAPATEVSKKS